MASIDKISVKGKEYVINEDKWAGVKTHNKYSTGEIDTGMTWIDGKPIYRKVVKTAGFSGNKVNNIAHGISKLGQIVDFRFYLMNSSGEITLPVPRIGYEGNALRESFSNYAYVTKTNIVFTCGSLSSYSSGYAIIEYTKA